MNITQDLLLRMFGRPQGMLGRLGVVIMPRANERCGMWVIELLQIAPKDAVLEVGFGPGVIIERISQRAAMTHVAGIDGSSEMVKQARIRNAAAIETGQVDLRQGSVENLCFGDNTFDKALAVNSMQVWTDVLAGLRQVRRVLKPAATLALGFTAYSGQSKPGLTELLSSAGFTTSQVLEKLVLRARVQVTVLTGLGRSSNLVLSQGERFMTYRSAATSTLIMLNCLALGLLAGGMLVIGVSFVSFWKSLTPGDFQAWFASHSHLIGRLMIPLGIAGIAISVAAGVASWLGQSGRRWWLLIAALSAIGVMATYPIFFAGTNETFLRGGLSDSEVRSLLNRWATWHWIRTGLGVAGFIASLRALQGS